MYFISVAYIEQYPDCPLSVHFTCIQKTFEGKLQLSN